jgi:LemA protein
MMIEGGAPMGIPFMIVLAAVGAIVVVVVVSYNRLVSLTQRSQSAWSDVDGLLKRRTDLAPNLVESVKGYASHERGALDAVVKARGAAVAAQTPESRAQAEGQLSHALRRLVALAESYPDLKVTATFQSLQASLGEIEEAIQNARRDFNAVVRDLNTAIQEFPSNLVAGFFQFRPHAYFELDRPGERQVPKVSFGG